MRSTGIGLQKAAAVFLFGQPEQVQTSGISGNEAEELLWNLSDTHPEAVDLIDNRV